VLFQVLLTNLRSDLPSMDGCSRVLSRGHIKELISLGHLIVISDKQVLRLDKWIERHPGGRLPILHMIGKDATDQVLVLSLHPLMETSFERMECYLPSC
jgi:hypothetical protein